MLDLQLVRDANRQLVGMPAAAVERELILATLTQTGGNRTHVAKMLGISIRTMRNKLAAYQRVALRST